MRKPANQSPQRNDAVFIRKSGDQQDERGQIANVENMLAAEKVVVAKDNWFGGTVSRRKVKTNESFRRLLDLVEADRIGTVYIESQDRWGTADRVELFTLLGTLREHQTRLYDLRAKKDLTERDLATEMLAFVNSIKSEKELQDISYRSLRTRVNNFKDTGTWPTGTHPFGYGKACYSPEGKLRWEWQPVSRSKGQIFYPGDDGTLHAGPSDVRIPQKARKEKRDKRDQSDKRDKTVLIPSNNRDFVETVRMVFDLYTGASLSRRQIAVRLNQEGRKFYSKPFNHTLVSQILANPAYVGDTHFGKTQTGELHTFDANGLIVELKKSNGKAARKVSERLIKQDTHEALVNRQTFDRAQAKLRAEGKRRCFAPRNPAYFLKPIFVCGHCGKNMTGRTETDPKTKEKTVIYVCSSWMQGKSSGQDTQCGYQRITHEDAEQLLLDKVAELKLPFDEAASDGIRTNFQQRLERIGVSDEEGAKRWQQMFNEGVDAFADYVNELLPDLGYREFQLLRKSAAQFYWGEENLTLARIHDAFADVAATIVTLENRIAETAAQRVLKLKEEHAEITLKWVKATGMQEAVLTNKVAELELEIRATEAQTVPLSKRFQQLYDEEAIRDSERQKLMEEWPSLENREKGESLRRLFSKVTLFWKREFHPARKDPSRPRKTERPGRYSYSLQREQIQWEFAEPGLGSSR